MKRIVFSSFLVFFTLLWGAAVGTGDVALGWGIYKQQAAASWPTVDGTVTKSDLRTSRGSKGRTNYHADIRYSYAVAGRGYTCDRTVFGADFMTGSQRAAEEWLSRFPLGAHAIVHYNPEDPSEATLTTGMQPGLMFMALLLVPFNATLIGFGTVTGGSLKRAILKPRAGGLRIVEDGDATLIRVSWWSPLSTGLTVAGAGSLLALLIVAVGFNQSLSVAQMAMVLGGVLGAGTVAALLAYTIGPRSDKYILVDLRAGILTVPAIGGVKQSTTFDLPAVQLIRTRQVQRGKSTLNYLCIDGFERDGSPKDVEWQLSLAEDRVESLAEFLKQRIGLVKNS